MNKVEDGYKNTPDRIWHTCSPLHGYDLGLGLTSDYLVYAENPDCPMPSCFFHKIDQNELVDVQLHNDVVSENQIHFA